MSERDYKYRIPEVLEAHRQTANWLVGLSAGALAGFATFLDRPRVHGSLEEWLLGIAALFFLLAIAAGVAFHLAITIFTNNYEQHARAEESVLWKRGALKEARVANEAAAVAAIEENLKELNTQQVDCDKHIKTWRKWYKRFYRVLTVCFYTALATGAGYIWFMARADAAPASRGDVLLLDGRDQDDTCLKYSALLLDTRTGVVHELFNDTITGGTKWVVAPAFARRLCKEEQEMMGSNAAKGRNQSEDISLGSSFEAKTDTLPSATE